MRKIGIYNPYLETRGGGEKVCLALASELSKDNETEVFLIAHNQIDIEPLEKFFNVDLSRVKFQNIDLNPWFLKLIRMLPFLGGPKSFIIDLYALNRLKNLNCDVFINNQYHSNLPNLGKYGVYMCMFPQKLDTTQEELGFLKSQYKKFLARLYKKYIYKNQKSGVYSYDKIVANSKFTQKYIKKYWDLDSEILYPICEDMSLPNASKEKIILNVGRFFGFDQVSHHKRQDFLLKAFSQSKDLQSAGWELHFAGSIANDKSAKKFVSKMQNDAKNLPVVFHFDASFKELKELYNKTTIYWHATGFGSDPDKYPEKQEHFGISTLEAMSAGAVPIVIDSAGQREIVINNKNGFLWDDQNQLKDQTLRVSKMKVSEINSLVQNGKQTVSQFNAQSFKKRVAELFDNI